MRTSARFRSYPNPLQAWSLWTAMEAQKLIYNAKVEHDRLQEWLQHRAILSPSWCVLNPDMNLDPKIDKTYAQFKLNHEIPCVPSRILTSGVDKYIQAVRNHQRNPNKWKKPRRHHFGRSVTLRRELFEFKEDGLWVGRPNWPVGHVRMKAHRPHGVPATVVIRETRAGRWFASFSWDDGGPEPATDRALKKQFAAEGEAALQGKVLGIDRGVRPVVALSTGADLGLDDILHGRKVQRLQARRRRLKRQLSRQKDRSSRRCQKTQRALARTFERLEDIRSDAFCKVVKRLVQGPCEVFVIEDLKLQGLWKALVSKNPGGRLKQQPREMRRKVAGAMMRTGLGEFAHRLQVAANRAGKLLLKVPAQHTSTTCSACGHNSPENRPDRDTFRCVACDQALDPDVNAARNLARRGIETLFPRPPAGQAGAQARGGADRKARRTAPQSGRKTSRSEQPALPAHPGGAEARHVDGCRSMDHPQPKRTKEVPRGASTPKNKKAAARHPGRDG